MGTSLGPRYIPYTYMDPLGQKLLLPAVLPESAQTGSHAPRLQAQYDRLGNV